MMCSRGFGGLPGCIGIEEFHFLECFESLWAEIFFINDSRVADDEALHACDLIFGRCGGKRKAADHGSLDDEVELAEWRG